MSNDPIRDRLNYPQCFPTGEDIMDAYQRPYEEATAEREELRQLRLLKSRVDDIDGIAEEICEYFEGNQNYVWVPLAKAIHDRIIGRQS